MTVQDLKDVLEGMDPKMEVHIAYDYGDYWKTLVAPEVINVEEQYVTYSDYHRMDKVTEDDENGKLVLVIS